MTEFLKNSNKNSCICIEKKEISLAVFHIWMVKKYAS